MKTIVKQHGSYYVRECDETDRNKCINCEGYDNCAFKPYNGVAMTMYAIIIIAVTLLTIWML